MSLGRFNQATSRTLTPTSDLGNREIPSRRPSPPSHRRPQASENGGARRRYGRTLTCQVLHVTHAAYRQTYTVSEPHLVPVAAHRFSSVGRRLSGPSPPASDGEDGESGQRLGAISAAEQPGGAGRVWARRGGPDTPHQMGARLGRRRSRRCCWAAPCRIGPRSLRCTSRYGTFTSPGSTASGPRSFSGGTPNVTAPWLTCSATRAMLGLAGRGRWSASCSPCDCALVGFRPGDVPGVPVLLR